MKNLIRLLTCVLFILPGITATAQVAQLQKIIDKLEGYKNFSYQYKQVSKDLTPDTQIIYHKDIIQKAPKDSTFGFLFSFDTQIAGDDENVVNLYNGQSLIHLQPKDSTYEFYDLKNHAQATTLASLPVYLKWLKGRPQKKPAVIAADSLINGEICTHLVFDIHDTIVNKVHNFSLISVFINKRSGLPAAIIYWARLSDFMVAGITDSYIANYYSNYKINQDNIDLAAMGVPAGYHPPKLVAALPLLSPGTSAPEWNLTTTDGKKIALSQLKGKVVMLDFFFIGCGACLESLKSIDTVYRQYKNKDFLLLSVSIRDPNKSLVAYKKMFNIDNEVCGDAVDVALAYHVNGAPVFYFIDKEGKIGGVINGNIPGLTAKARGTIDELLKI